jgi:hypothetical protein
MKTAISTASVLAFAFSLNAQVTATLKICDTSVAISCPLGDGSSELRIRNDRAVGLSAFAIALNPPDGPVENGPRLVFVDTEIDTAANPVLPKQEILVSGWAPLVRNRRRTHITPEQPLVSAGVFADGATTGDMDLLRRLILRRANMLQAVEASLDVLSDAGKHNVPRDQLIGQFQTMADSLDHWYLPPEQHAGRSLYQSIVGKLINLPAEGVGSAFPPTAFVVEETAMLRQWRVTLLESQPNLAGAARIAR